MNSLTTSNLGKARVLQFCLIAALLSTFSSRYTFGGGNQLDHLPLVMRAVDPGFLQNDQFVNSGMEFGQPRYYYAKLVGILASFTSIQTTFFTLTVLSRFLLALVTYYVATRIHSGKCVAGVLSTALVLCVDAFWLGDATEISESYLQPSLLSRSFALFSFWCALDQKYYLAFGFGLISIPLHPLVGFETATIGILVSVIDNLILYTRKQETLRRITSNLMQCGCVTLGYAATLYILFIQYRQEILSLEEFYEIFVIGRIPHHLVPSNFGRREYCMAFLFLVGSCLATKSLKERSHRIRFYLTAALIVVSLVLTYIFVDLIPTRAFAVAQLFRMLSIIKWIGLIAVAGLAGRLLETRKSWLYGWGILSIAGSFYPVTLVSVLLLFLMQNFVIKNMGENVFRIGAGLLILQASTLNSNAPWNELQGVLIVILFGFIYLALDRKNILDLLPLTGAGVISLALLSGVNIRFLPLPQTTIEKLEDPLSQIAYFANEHTPKDSIFILPPGLTSNFRVTAKRAVYVQWKTVPFSDSALLDWDRRIRKICCVEDGEVRPSDGNELNLLYQNCTESIFRQIASDKQAHYAVVPRDFESNFAVLCSHEDFKLIELQPAGVLPES